MSESLERKVYQSSNPIARLVLAHGAGAGNQHEFMDTLSKSLCESGIEVISFNFDYMVRQYQEQKKRPPDRQDKLLARFELEIQKAAIDNLPLFIAGKSMGGRMATLYSGEALDKVNGVIVYGYPFIPPGKPEKLQQRMAHFAEATTPVLICQGERDTFGNKSLLQDLSMPKQFELEWITSGDHSFKPLKSSGLDSLDNIQRAAALTTSFIKRLS